jgi:sialate O-acetylesterase
MFGCFFVMFMSGCATLHSGGEASLNLASKPAVLKLPAIFGDHMVLQQDADYPIWGWASPGSIVRVDVGPYGVLVRANSDGKWYAEMSRLRAGGPFDMTVSSKEESIAFTDVLVGEVWIASGQSNMQWGLNRTENAAEAIAAAEYPEIRLFHVDRKTSTKPADDVVGTWKKCSSKSVANFSAVAYYFGREIHLGQKVPVGLIHTSWGGTPAQAWVSHEALVSKPDLRFYLEREEELKTKVPEAGTEDEPERPQGRPSRLYNAMIAPLVPFAFRGAIWYQGESNASPREAPVYDELFSTMISDWRDRWGNGDFPFYFVQLANYKERTEEPQPTTGWALLRESQLNTLALPNTGMAVIIDIGEADDIHPQNKLDVGRRLALAASANTYENEVPYSGPIYQASKKTGGAIRLSFDHTNGGLMAKGGEGLAGFAIAGDDQKFVWADAEIEGDEVIVSSPTVNSPVAVRYAWADNPACNLVNGAGLPASPFRTDDWE